MEIVFINKLRILHIVYYYQTEDGQIQADLARRLRIILEQYQEYVPNTTKYEVSLCLAIMQTLLTNCVELMNELKQSARKTNPFYNYPIDSTLWGFNNESIIFNSFNQPELTIEKVVRHIRNALSHPTKINKFNGPYKTTGYFANENLGNIKSINFVSSPDLNGKGNPKTFDSIEKAEQKIRESAGTFPSEIIINKTSNNKFGIFLDGELFFRIFEIELRPEQIYTFTNSLARYLSLPLMEKWDGETFTFQKRVA